MRIFVNEGKYTKLTKEEALLYFQDDSENLENIENDTHDAYLFLESEWVGKFVQYAVVQKGFNPANIDEWQEDDWVFVEDKIRLIGD